MKKNLTKYLKIIIPVALGLYLVWHIYNQLSLEQRTELFRAFEQANYLWVLLSMSMGVLSHWIRGFRWSYQLEAMGYQPNNANNFMAVMIGYVVNMALPRVGEVSRAAALTRYEQIPFQKTFGSILSERTLDFIILLLITATTVILQFEAMSPYVEEFSHILLEKINLQIGIVVAILGLILLTVSVFLIRRFSHTTFVGKLRGFVNELLEGLRSIIRMKKRGRYLFSTLAIWILYIGMFWVCFFSLKETSHLGISAIFAGFVLGSFAIVIIPGGIGAFPAGIMQALLLYGVAAESGFALGWILWFSQTLMVLTVGGACMIFMPIFNKNRLHESN